MRTFWIILVLIAAVALRFGAADELARSRPSGPVATWNVTVLDGSDYLVWQTGFATKLACFGRAAWLNTKYANSVFTCAQVFHRALPFQ